MGSALGASFFKETIKALIFAFVLMGLVVFAYFRVPIPSLAVILSAVSDIIITLAILNIFNVKISTAGIAAFLMLIGYSVDTDILLSTHALKRQGKLKERIFNAMRTGLTTTSTTIVAVSLALIFAKSAIIYEIMLIVLIGLLVDLVNTWIQNVGILRYYLERFKGEKA
jgi:preprotein translocase subunit SecF